MSTFEELVQLRKEKETINKRMEELFCKAIEDGSDIKITKDGFYIEPNSFLEHVLQQ